MKLLSTTISTRILFKFLRLSIGWFEDEIRIAKKNLRWRSRTRKWVKMGPHFGIRWIWSPDLIYDGRGPLKPFRNSSLQFLLFFDGSSFCHLLKKKRSNRKKKCQGNSPTSRDGQVACVFCFFLLFPSFFFFISFYFLCSLSFYLTTLSLSLSFSLHKSEWNEPEIGLLNDGWMWFDWESTVDQRHLWSIAVPTCFRVLLHSGGCGRSGKRL